MFSLWSFLGLFITVIIIVVVVYFIINPTPVTLLLDKLNPGVIYKANSNALVNTDYTLYSDPKSTHEQLVIVFIGGAGLFSTVSNVYGLTNELNEQLGPTYDILTFNYPTRYKYTIQQTMLAINEKLKNYITYTKIHVIGISFGALLAGAFFHKEAHSEISTQMGVPQIGMHFKSFIILSGLMETKFNSILLEKIFQMYILRGTPGIQHYSCYGIKVPKFVISAKSDFLLAQSMKFIESEHCEYKMYESTILPHAFAQLIHLDNSKDSIQRMVKFIETHNNIDSTQENSGVVNSGNTYSTNVG